MTQLPFRDRVDAGQRLAAELKSRHLPADVIVLALPRGGVPVGFEIAKALHAPLDVVVVRKLGVPWERELAMGAIAGNAVELLDRDLIATLRISQQEVDAAIRNERAELERREKLYRGGHAAPDLRSRTVILADDGLATGSTMIVAIRYVRGFKPAKIIVAVPVSSSDAAKRVRQLADELVCLAIPESFMAVGEWYVDFHQVSDEEVRNLMERSREIETEPLHARR